MKNYSKFNMKNEERFTNLRVILAAGAMLIFSVSFQFLHMCCRSKHEFGQFEEWYLWP